MNTQRDNMWSAYMDGELSARDAAEFDESLTAEERETLAGEMRLERDLAEVLSRDAACPDDVWERTKQRLAEKADEPVARPKLATRPWARPLALAAAILLTVAWWMGRGTAEPEFLTLAEHTVMALKATNELDGTALSDLNAYLEAHDVDVALKPMGSGGHPRMLLGVREAHYGDEEVIEVLFNCCDKPLKVVLIPQGGMAAQEAGGALGTGHVQAIQPVGSFVAALVGDHHSEDILDYFTKDWEIGVHQG